MKHSPKTRAKRRPRPTRDTASPGEFTTAIIGCGLIGTSIGLALRHAMPRARVIGFDRRVSQARLAQRREGLTSIAASLDEAVAAADVTILATPRAQVIALLPRVFRAARKGSLIMDVAGLKVEIAAAAIPVLATFEEVSFAAGHPMAGSERAGPWAAGADLFRGRPFALCVPAQRGEKSAQRRAASFVRLIGAHPLPIAAAHHDRIVAATSALPQLVSSSMALAVAASGRHLGLTGPGLEGMTRLAASPAALWTDALIENKRNVEEALGAFEATLADFHQAIKAGDRMRLKRLLRSSAAAQRRLRSR